MDVRFCGAPFPQICDPQERDFTVDIKLKMENKLACVERRMEEEASNILEITRDHSKTLEFLWSNGLLKDNIICSSCNNDMNEINKK